MSRKSSRGYTLVELVVAVAVVAVLATIGLPEYTRSVETSRALNSLTIVQTIGHANKSHYMDRGVYANGTLTSDCNTACCAGTPGCAAAANAACNLVACGYLAKQAFSQSHYYYKAGPAACGGGFIACGGRKQCVVYPSDPFCIDDSAWPFRCWGYNYAANNILTGDPNPKSPPPLPN
jgi:prepilin-type N-terminal cleavage/methylation domain-containing protein